MRNGGPDEARAGIKIARRNISDLIYATLMAERELNWTEVAQSCLTLSDPIDCSLPGSSVHGILQAIVLEWVTISFSRGSSRPRDRTRVSHIGGRRFNLWTTRAEYKEELKSLLMTAREWKRCLKAQHSKMKIMASGPIASWQIDGETMETVTDFIFLGSKITADGACSHEIKRRLLLGRKAIMNLAK